MVFIKWNKEKVETEEGRIKNPKELEERLEKLGWKNLSWHPGHFLKNPGEGELHGLPPNYEGPYDVNSYKECAIVTLAVPERLYEDSGEILVRDVLHRPINYNTDSVIPN